MKRTNPIIALLAILCLGLAFAACIVVALVTFAADGLFAALQRAVTPRGIKIHANQSRPASRVPFLSPKRSYQST